MSIIIRPITQELLANIPAHGTVDTALPRGAEPVTSVRMQMTNAGCFY